MNYVLLIIFVSIVAIVLWGVYWCFKTLRNGYRVRATGGSEISEYDSKMYVNASYLLPLLSFVAFTIITFGYNSEKGIDTPLSHFVFVSIGASLLLMLPSMIFLLHEKNKIMNITFLFITCFIITSTMTQKLISMIDFSQITELSTKTVSFNKYEEIKRRKAANSYNLHVSPGCTIGEHYLSVIDMGVHVHRQFKELNLKPNELIDIKLVQGRLGNIYVTSIEKSKLVKPTC